MITFMTIGKATARNPEEWDKQASTREEIRNLLKQRQGFAFVQFLWEPESGEFIVLTAWETDEDFNAYRKSPTREDAIARLSLLRGGELVRKKYIVG